MARFTVTYDVVTHESAEHGDVEKSGFASPGYWRHDEPAYLSLKECLSACGLFGGRTTAFQDCGSWFEMIDAETDFRTGDETRYSIHPPKNITRSSYRRLARVLTGKA